MVEEISIEVAIESALKLLRLYFITTHNQRGDSYDR